MLKRAVSRLADLLMPPSCPACKDEIAAHGGLCAACWSGLHPIANPCHRCGEPLPDLRVADGVCMKCTQEPPPFAAAAGAYRYADTSRSLVLALKNGAEQLAPMLARPMARTVATQFDPAQLSGLRVVPVPLHPVRLWQRGFNQALLLARHIAGHELAGAMPVLDPGVLKRVRWAGSTGGAGRRQRARLLAGAFAVPDAARPRLTGRPILLVDDVLTTGATAAAAARTLTRAGSGPVFVITFARVAADDGTAYL